MIRMSTLIFSFTCLVYVFLLPPSPMRLLLFVFSPITLSFGSGFFGTVDPPEQILGCSLTVTGDQLLSLPVGAGGVGDPLSTAQPYIVNMVVDTGAKHSLIFDPRIPSQKRSSYSISPDGNEVKFQTFVVEKRGVNTVPLSTTACNFVATIPQGSIEMAAPLKPDYGLEAIQGLVGLNLDAINGNSLFLTRPFEAIRSISIKFPSVLQPGVTSDGMMLIKSKKFAIRGAYDGPYFHVNSRHYWSTIVTKLTIGKNKGNADIVIPAPPGKNIAVVFDTGSNYFGVTDGLYADVQEAIRDGNAGFIIEMMRYFDTNTDSKPTPVSMKFPSDSMGNFNKDLIQGFLVEKIDQSQFDDLANFEIVVIGTRGLRGKTLSIFPNDSPAKVGEFLLSVTN